MSTLTLDKPAGWHIRVATRADNADLLRLSALCPMEGNMSLYVDRRPDYFRLYELFDSEACVWVAERDSGPEACLAAVHETLLWNGEPVRAAYFRDFKISPPQRGGMLGVRLVREAIRHELAQGTHCVLASILEGNNRSLAFTQGRADIPKSVFLGAVRYYTVPPLMRMRSRLPLRLEVWREEFVAEASDLLAEVWRNQELTPFDRSSLLQKLQAMPGVQRQDIMTAWSGSRMVGLLVIWDYYSLMRYVVTRFTWRLNVLRCVLRVASRVMPVPVSPDPGTPLRFRFVALVATRDLEVLRSLLTPLHNEMRGGCWSHYALCLHERDPLNAVMERQFTSHVVSNLYLFPNPDIDRPWQSLAGRCIFPGLATYL